MGLNILFNYLLVHPQQHKGFVSRLMINAGTSILVASDATLSDITQHMEAHKRHYIFIVKINYDLKSLVPLYPDITRKLLLEYLIACNH